MPICPGAIRMRKRYGYFAAAHNCVTAAAQIIPEIQPACNSCRKNRPDLIEHINLAFHSLLSSLEDSFAPLDSLLLDVSVSCSFGLFCYSPYSSFIYFFSSIGFRGPPGEIVCEISVTPASSAFQSGTYRHALPLAYFRTARRAPAHLGVSVRDGGC